MRWPLWRVAVAERSMEPALRPGDWLLTWRGLNQSRPRGSGRASSWSRVILPSPICCW